MPGPKEYEKVDDPKTIKDADERAVAKHYKDKGCEVCRKPQAKVRWLKLWSAPIVGEKAAPARPAPPREKSRKSSKSNQVNHAG